MMKLGKLSALLGLLAMNAALIYGFTFGDFQAEGNQLLAMPWGTVSLVDLYMGFILFSGWIFYREKSLVTARLWAIAMMLLGFWAGSLYVLLALITSYGDWDQFWSGRHAIQNA